MTPHVAELVKRKQAGRPAAKPHRVTMRLPGEAFYKLHKLAEQFGQSRTGFAEDLLEAALLDLPEVIR